MRPSASTGELGVGAGAGRMPGTTLTFISDPVSLSPLCCWVTSGPWRGKAGVVGRYCQALPPSLVSARADSWAGASVQLTYTQGARPCGPPMLSAHLLSHIPRILGMPTLGPFSGMHATCCPDVSRLEPLSPVHSEHMEGRQADPGPLGPCPTPPPPPGLCPQASPCQLLGSAGQPPTPSCPLLLQ